MLKDFCYNNLDYLFDRLADNIDLSENSPLESEIIVTQTDGIKKWLSLKIAEKYGICCNIEFLKPKYLIYKLLKAVHLDFDDKHPLERKNTFWLITKSLQDPTIDNVLKDYLGDNETKLAQFAYNIADLFEQYFVYRPDLIINWEKGELLYKDDIIEKWQFALYSKIIEKSLVKSFPTAVFEKLYKNKVIDIDLKKLPKKVSIFAISILPPFYVSILKTFSEYFDIYIYLLNPSKEFWFEYQKPKNNTKGLHPFETLDSRNTKGSHPPETPSLLLSSEEKSAIEELYNVKNSLLSNFGKIGADFYSNLIEDFDYISLGYEIEENANNIGKKDYKPTMLEIVKDDILNDRNMNELKKAEIEDFDGSIEIHSCHSPMREVEVLYNRLLNIFENNPEIKPSDVLVMTPDISAYAPFIDAIFGSQKIVKHFPYSISDVSFIDEDNTISIFMDILKLIKGRFETSKIINIIENEAIRTHFSLNDTDINLLKVCIKEAAIKWGIDKDFRKDRGIEFSYNEYSWEYGIERLLLSIIYESDDLYEHIKAIDNIGTNANDAIATISVFLLDLYNLYVFSKDKQHNIDDWYMTLISLMDQIFPNIEKAPIKIRRGIIAIKNSLDEMLESYNNYRADNEDIAVGIDFILEYFNRNFKNKLHSYRFLDGNITFCEMIPMRSIPFKIICVIGLNNNTYPRKRKSLSFDLMAQHIRKGDRNLRDNDKYLFLETIISAEKKLYLSYVGQDIVLNSNIPPSVLISQFIYYLKSRFIVKSTNNFEDDIVVKHKIFSFNPVYFTKDKEPFYINYRAEDFNAANVLVRRGNIENKKFIDDKEINSKPENNIINVFDLLNFFENPIEHYFKKTLKVNFDEKRFSLEDEEPFDLGTLQEFSVKETLIDNYFKEKDIKKYIFKYTGILPPGGAGMSEFDDAFNDVKNFLSFLSEKYLLNKERITYDINFTYKNSSNEEYLVEGVLSYFHKLNVPNRRESVIENLKGYNLASYRLSNTKQKNIKIPIEVRLKTYLKHLILNYYEFISGAKHLSDSYLFGKEVEDGKVAYKAYRYFTLFPQQLYKEIFNYIIDLYLSGLKKPLHFLPKYSYECFKSTKKINYTNMINDIKKPHNRPLDNYTLFYLKDFEPAESFFDKKFIETAVKIYGYMKDAEEELNDQ